MGQEEPGPVVAAIARILQAGDYPRLLRRRPNGGTLHSPWLTQRSQRRGSGHKAVMRPQPPTTATFLCARDHRLVIADGLFAETKELILGIVVMAPRDLDARSLEVAGQIPPRAPARSR